MVNIKKMLPGNVTQQKYNLSYKFAFIVAMTTLLIVTVSSVMAFDGRGWNNDEHRYQWDSGFHSLSEAFEAITVDGNGNPQPHKFDPVTHTQLAYPAGPDMSGNNAQSISQGFDTQHRPGKCKSDRIGAASFGFTDLNQYIRGLTTIVGEGTQGIGFISLSLVGKKITIGIWQKGKNGYDGTQYNQRRTNALFLQDYIVKAADIGQKDAQTFSINCPDSVNPISPAPLTGIPLDPRLSVCSPGTLVKVGNGSNVRPLKEYASSGLNGIGFTELLNPVPPICSTHPDHRHLSIGGPGFTDQTGVNGTPPCESDGYAIPFTQAPFSQYKTLFTTIQLKDKHGRPTSVKVSGEFYVGFLIDLTVDDIKKAALEGWYVPQHDNNFAYYDKKGNYLGPQTDLGGGFINGWDDIQYFGLGMSLVDTTMPGPGGISYAGIKTSGYKDVTGNIDPTTIVPIANNTSATGPLNEQRMLSFFFPPGSLPQFASGINLTGTLDVFFSIRAIPENEHGCKD